MILLSVVQLIVAVMQFIQSFAFSNDTRTIIWGITMVVITAIVFAYLSKKIFSKK
jgi:hypothetical protein